LNYCPKLQAKLARVLFSCRSQLWGCSSSIRGFFHTLLLFSRFSKCKLSTLAFQMLTRVSFFQSIHTWVWYISRIEVLVQNGMASTANCIDCVDNLRSCSISILKFPFHPFHLSVFLSLIVFAVFKSFDGGKCCVRLLTLVRDRYHKASPSSPRCSFACWSGEVWLNIVHELTVVSKEEWSIFKKEKNMYYVLVALIICIGHCSHYMYYSLLSLYFVPHSHYILYPFNIYCQIYNKNGICTMVSQHPTL
jgi:hypothetical protein